MELRRLPTSLAELRRVAMELEGDHARILHPRYACPEFRLDGETRPVPLYLSLSAHVRAFEVRLVYGGKTVVSERHERPFAKAEVLTEIQTLSGKQQILRVDAPDWTEALQGEPRPLHLALHVSTLLPDGHHPLVRCPKSLVILPDSEAPLFAVMSDFHFLDAKIRWHDRHTTTHALAVKAVRQAREQGVQFILGAGDLASYVFLYARSFPRARRFFRHECPLPNALIPGNHDGYILGRNGAAWLDGQRIWRRLFGPTHYSFAIGNLRYIGLNSYDWPHRDRNLLNLRGALRGQFNQAGRVGSEQMRWLEEELDAARERGEEILIFVHHNPLHVRMHRANGKTWRGGWEGPERIEMLEMLHRARVRAIFSGHEHFEQSEFYKDVPVYTGASIGGVHDRGEFWGYRSVRVEPGRGLRIVSHRVF